MNFIVQNKKNNIFKIFYNHLKAYPTPANFSYFFNFGFLAGISLFIQIISGIFLAMHYSTTSFYSFDSIEHIMRDVSEGWYLRYLHANGASMFFMVVYIHIARGLYYQSFVYENRSVWLSGLLIFVAMMATAFIGYVLPWGQMSFWGATVITNLFSAIPIFGQELVFWLWGGFSVSGATLNRFFSLHYLLPFIILLLVIVHLYYLHLIGSSNPFPLEYKKINSFVLFFYPYFFVKDLFGVLIFLYILHFLISYSPNYLGHSDNYIEANPLVTPEHIVPEWYFLPFYAILRAIPNKLGGIFAMGGAILILFLLPIIYYIFEHFFFIKRFLYASNVSNFSKSILFFFFWSFLFLGWLGSQPVEEPFISLGMLFTWIYFSILLYLPLQAFAISFLLKKSYT